MNPPVCKQCLVEDDKRFGSIVVRVELDDGSVLWGGFDPTSSGFWATPEEVEMIEEFWTTMVPETPDEG